MPWQETLLMDQRVQFIADYQRDVFDVADLARRYGISRKTAYKWIHRYDVGGPAGPRGRRVPAHPGRPLIPMTAPNGTWTADFKGQFKTRNGVYCYPLTVVDGFSRALLTGAR